MPATAPQSPTTVVNLDAGGNDFINPSSAAGAPNGVGATIGADGWTDRLDGSGFSFGVPAGSIIIGISVVVVSKGGLIT